MTAGLLYKCKWRHGHGHRTYQGWNLLLFLGVETINRSDGVVINNYRFHDVIKNESVLMDKGLIKYCEEIKGDNHECD